MSLTVSMPYYRSSETVRRAVDSVLAQTFTDLRLIVVNDGDDPEKAWEPLADIDDPRLVRFDLTQNRGRYWVDAVTAEACDTEWWTPHDSDDFSVPHRFQTLIEAVGGMDAAFSPTIYHKLNGQKMRDAIKTANIKRGELRTIARYPAGIYRTEVIRHLRIDPTIRLSHDTAIVNVMFKRHKVATVPDVLYHVHKRRGSLTTAKATKKGTRYRQRHQTLRWEWYQRRLGGRYQRKETPEFHQDVERLQAMLES